MHLSSHVSRYGSVLLITMMICLSCAGRTYLMVDYRVPPATDHLQGQTVRIVMVDNRQDASVLTPEAVRHFSEFDNRYSLAWLMPDNERILAGEHDLLNALRESFKKRLTQMGADVTLRSQGDIAVLTVALDQLKIDLQNRKWVVDLGYSATLSKGSESRSKETVRGNAERVRVLGRKGADMALSDIFSDATNRLDVIKMFQQAGLIP